ncbi:uncharacterized protein Z519_06166 [Cladophialophora bantiana CBS 173.52]|uniref:F-box domain-containing protein n=1 Tax=Cladophialophora bantiana (strain ATCC 10958 / CBS 173.52 / CDC B-1940 / NIH 8579) TaxID=1442370 RepID=A0A0D2EUN7_CLAB1|nr:uncharacterized protein Z519_06166 [Cladophialophora bantiana CBS 173.52]KIW93561.1 hypothetical protein Z519_06166 [Cladophialophora bantiana CBS 173.52]
MLMPAKRPRLERRATTDRRNGMRNGRGRPMKQFNELKPSRKDRTLQSSIIHKQLTAEIETPKEASALELLPVEIIEQIFFDCLELNLPRASPHLARALSRRSIYSALVLFAYFEVDSSSYVETRHFLPAAFRVIGCDNQRRLQEDILRTRWCTLDLLQSCMPALARLTMLRLWHRQKEKIDRAKEETIAERTDNQESFGNGIVLPDFDSILPALDDQSSMEKYFSLEAAMLPNGQQDQTASSETSNEYLNSFIETSPDWAIQRPWTSHHLLPTWTTKSIFAVYVIPDNIVLRKPWTDTNMKLLRLLIQGIRPEGLGDQGVPSFQAMCDGMANAIQEGNVKALRVLVNLNDTIGRAGQALPLSLLHLACQQPTLPVHLQCRIMLQLLRNPATCAKIVAADDEILLRWALRTASSSPAAHHVPIARAVLLAMGMKTQ